MSALHSRPQKLPVELETKLFALELGRANYAVGLLEGSQRRLLNPSLLIAPLTAKEAEESSKIEGTLSSASDVFIYEAGGGAKYSDTIEVSNYRKTIIAAVGEMQKGRPITAHLIKSLHGNLLKDTRHKGILGEFRKAAVWIGEKRTDPIEKAIYVPPEAIHVPGYVENLLEYMDKTDLDPLVQAGVAHYQFEAIHPFEDGNGRIGRLLIPLLLYRRGLISSPVIYLSGYLEENRDEYREMLHSADQSGHLEQWLAFFLKAVAAQAGETQRLIDEINKLYDELAESFDAVKSPYSRKLLDFIFKRPAFTLPDVGRHLKAAPLTCRRLVGQLLAKKVVSPLPQKFGRAKLYSFTKLINLLR
jgi:Fic family protein